MKCHTENTNLCSSFPPATSILCLLYCPHADFKYSGSADRCSGSNKAGVLEKLDKNLVDKLILGYGLYH